MGVCVGASESYRTLIHSVASFVMQADMHRVHRSSHMMHTYLVPSRHELGALSRDSKDVPNRHAASLVQLDITERR